MDGKPPRSTRAGPWPAQAGRGISRLLRLGIPRLTVAKILNHADRSVTAIYDRHSYDPEKRDALEKWARKLRALVATDGDVIQLRA